MTVFEKIKKPISFFYQTLVDVGTLPKTKDDYGGVVNGTFTKTASIKVNLNLADSKVREQFGVDSESQITMTLAPLGQDFTHAKIDGKIYQITNINKFASHWKALLLCL